MKYPNHLTRVGNATILHQLFPLEIPGLIAYIENACITTLQGQQQTPYVWDTQILSHKQWIKSLEYLQLYIEEYRTALCKSAYVFSSVLFNQRAEYASTYFLNLYITTHTHLDPEFTNLAQLLHRKLTSQTLQTPEYITHAETYPDQWICLCANEAESEGFNSCDKNGDLVEPIEGLWDDLYVCMKCGRIIDQSDRQVVGYNPHPRPLEDFDSI